MDHSPGAEVASLSHGAATPGTPCTHGSGLSCGAPGRAGSPDEQMPLGPAMVSCPDEAAGVRICPPPIAARASDGAPKPSPVRARASVRTNGRAITHSKDSLDGVRTPLLPVTLG